MKKTGSLLLFLLAFVLLTGILKSQLYHHGKLGNLSDTLLTSDRFRQMELSRENLEILAEFQSKGYSPGRILSVLLPWNDFRTSPASLWTLEEYEKAFLEFSTYRGENLQKVQTGFLAIWDDLKVFPVETAVSYENSWMSERNYGGSRDHEGCDLMPPKNQRELYPILSITDGTVENIGWLPKGGYRIGIRSPRGGYFYYAHFSSYGKDFQVGDSVAAGTVLGYMGDSGYGEEGTVGKFDVHLHLGIYIQTDEAPEVSVNPYWILRYLSFCENMNKE